MQKKKGCFAESLLLFPVGQHIANAANVRVQAFYRDRQFLTDLDNCLASVGQMKTFQLETVYKAEAGEIHVPGQAKVAEAQATFSLVLQASSEQFKQANAQKLELVGAKFEELKVALLAAMCAKFKKQCANLEVVLQSLVQATKENEGIADQLQPTVPVQCFHFALLHDPIGLGCCNVNQ